MTPSSRRRLPSKARTEAPACLDEDTIAAFLGGSLSARALERVEVHLAACDECIRVLGAAAESGGRGPLEGETQSDGGGLGSTRFPGVGSSSFGRLLSWIHSGQSSPSRHDAARSFHDALLDASFEGRFELRETLGRGGMGTVYRAYDRASGHEVALKVLHGVGGAERSRLKDEFRAIATLDHPNLASLYELVINDRVSFISMELVHGSSFSNYHRRARAGGDGDISYERLRDTARQLALALACLHGADKLHRDVKPSNALITETGRVVLLDFGLVWPLCPNVPSTPDAAIAGTPQYMAPEQRAGGVLTPAADWYAFGVTLYHAITGELPRRGGARSLRARGYALPEELDALLVRLLDTAPDARPSADEILVCLGAEPSASRSSALPRLNHRLPLVGREAEMQRLREAWAATEAGELRHLHVSGPSGIGKTRLIEHFLDEVTAAAPDRTLVLASRCHPREAIAFNALDGWIDALARELPRRLPIELIPSGEGYAALAQVFPVLGPWLAARGSPAENAHMTERERRGLAFRCLQAILRQLATRWRLVIWMDDVQWGDHDSGVALRALLGESAGEKPACRTPALVISSYREEDRQLCPYLRALEEAAREATEDERRELRLAPLPFSAGTRIVDAFLNGNPRDTEAVARLIHDTSGSPFLLSELGHWLSTARPEAMRASTLDLILRERTANLSADSMALLEVFCVAGHPFEHATALRASGLSAFDRAAITQLENLSLLRTTSLEGRCAEPYHHRIREQVCSELSLERRQARHRAIASALMTMVVPDPLLAVEHFIAAGDDQSVRRHILFAANQASRTLAFDRAAKLYATAIALGVTDSTPHELQEQLGTALANAGRGGEAAAAFLQAAQLLQRVPGADGRRSLKWRQTAAEQQLQAGYYDAGLETLHALVDDLGIAFPRSRRRALLEASLLRLECILQDTFSVAPVPHVATTDELERFDALWGVGIRFGMVDYALINYALARCAAEARRLGDPVRRARTLAAEATLWVTMPPSFCQRRAQTLMDAAERISSSDAGPYDRALLLAMRGIIATYNGRFRQSAQLTQQALRILREASTGMQYNYQYTLWQFSELVALGSLGDVPELIRKVRAGCERADHRGDRLAFQTFSLGPATLAWLALDLPEVAAARAEQAARYLPSAYTLQHFHHYVSTVEVELYRGQPALAWQHSVDNWRQHRQQFVRWLVFGRDHLLQTHARAAVAMAAALQASPGSQAPGGYTAERLRRVVLKAADEMDRHGLDCGASWAELLRAAVARLERRPAHAQKHLRQAMALCERCDLLLYRDAAQYCLASLAEDGERQPTLQQAENALRARGIDDPVAMLNVLCPGLLEQN